jgi:hypothetical protein
LVAPAGFETKRFQVDPDTAGLWEQVKGDLHRRLSVDQGNGRALRIVSRIYLDMARRDPAGLARVLTGLQLEDQGYQR